jgi:hypothetical protein
MGEFDGWLKAIISLGDLPGISGAGPWSIISVLIMLPVILAIWTGTGPVILGVLFLCALLTGFLTGILPLASPEAGLAASVLAAVIVGLLAHGVLLQERRRSVIEMRERLHAMEVRIDRFLEALDRRASIIDQHVAEERRPKT